MTFELKIHFHNYVSFQTKLPFQDTEWFKHWMCIVFTTFIINNESDKEF